MSAWKQQQGDQRCEPLLNAHSPLGRTVPARAYQGLGLGRVQGLAYPEPQSLTARGRHWR
jgi:hypothetical protein